MFGTLVAADERKRKEKSKEKKRKKEKRKTIIPLYMFENEERMRKGREEYAHISFVWFAKKREMKIKR